MAVGVTDITVDVSETCATITVSTDIVAVVDSEGAAWTVFISSAWAESCGTNISHNASSAVINADLSINLLITLPPCRHNVC